MPFSANATALPQSGLILVDGKASGNVAIAGGIINGTVYNGRTWSTGERCLFTDQTVASENGIYTIPATGTATRDPLMASAFDATGSQVFVKSGSGGGATYNQIGAPGIVGTNSLFFVPFNQGVVAEYVEATLAADITTQGASAAFDIVSITLPSAGDWEIVAEANTGALAINTSTFWLSDGANNIINGTGKRGEYPTNSIRFPVTINKRLNSQPAGTIIKFRAMANVVNSLAIMNQTGTPQAATGGTKIYAVKVSGLVPTSGQTVDYISISALAAQTTGIAVGSPVLFPTPDSKGNIPQSNGIFSLQAGKTYQMLGQVGQHTFTSNSAIVQWRNLTTGLLIGTAAYLDPVSTTTATTALIAQATITPAVPTNVQLEFRNIGASITSIGANDSNGNRSNWATIWQIGTTAITGGVQSPITLTTTGTGAATFTQSTGLLNIPVGSSLNNWTTGVVYAVGDVVIDVATGTIWKNLVAHTSTGAGITADTIATNWTPLFSATLPPTAVSTVAYTVTNADYSLRFSGANGTTTTVTLPTPSASTGRILYLNNIFGATIVSASANVVLQSTLATTQTQILPTVAASWGILQSNGTAWFVIASGQASGAAMIAATAVAAGTSGAVPTPPIGSINRVLKGDATFTANIPVWLPSRYYDVGDVVIDGVNSTIYRNLVAHTSGAVSAIEFDSPNVNWSLVSTQTNRATDIALTAYTVRMEDWSIRFTAATAVTVTLTQVSPPPELRGKTIYISNVNAIAVTSATANVIQQNVGFLGTPTTQILPAVAGAWALLQYNATNWIIMASGQPATAATTYPVQRFLANGTYTPTAGIRGARVRIQAGGGGSSGAPAGSVSTIGLGQGGTAGNYIEAIFTAAQMGAGAIAITIGAGGTAGVGGTGVGGAGGLSSFGNFLSATGGPGGVASGAGATAFRAGGTTPTANQGTLLATAGVVVATKNGDPSTHALGWINGTTIICQAAKGGSTLFGNPSNAQINIAATTAAVFCVNGILIPANTGAGASGVYSGGTGSVAIDGNAGSSGIIIIEEF